MLTFFRITAFISLAFTLMLLSACKQNKPDSGQAPSAPRAVEVNAVVVKPKMIENKIFSTGNILANEEVEIRAEVPGRIISINFREGSLVKKGDLLVKINDNELQAELKKLLLDEKLAQDDVFRKEKLLELKAVSQEELDISRNQLGIIQAQIDLVRARLEKTGIYAPFSGRIGLRYVSPGGYISSSMLIARMQQTDPVKIEFNVPEKYISGLKTEMDVQFSVAGSDSIFTGQVYAIEPRIDPSTRSFGVRARSANPGGLLTPGAFTKVNIILEKIPDALVLPSDALIPDISGEKVLLCRNGKVATTYIHTGIRTEHEVQVTDGLSPFDTVITSGLLQLRDQMSVKPRLTGNN
ncbi:MAG: efflux RND transporter periplasmic adaptor subunit [Bacteroidales bacterium]|jgi:membrane fusion protein (multidrug efflux system)|nr:efflux RND transporter periplasmic adaptor subunit [Bacteroidales bacterium]